jgi:hypothetical protein
VGKGRTFEELYVQERKKAQVFGAATVVLAFLLAGSVLVGLGKQPAPPMATGPGAGGFDGRMGGQGMGEGGYGGQTGQGAPIIRGPGSGGSGGKVLMPGDQITDYLSADGTVNSNKIKDNLNSKYGPPEMMETGLRARARQIDEAEAGGQITPQQADELRRAWIDEAEAGGKITSQQAVELRRAWGTE